MKNSVYDIIKSAVDENGLLPQDFSLPDYDSETKIRFAPGAMDGIMMFHGALSGNSGGDGYNRLCKIIELASDGDYNAMYEEADKFAVKGHVLADIDGLQEYIIAQKDRLNAENLYNCAALLTVEAVRSETVKVGMAIMELFNTNANEEYKKRVRTLALCDEFTLYSAYIMRGWDNSNEEFFEAVKKVKGWGRVFLVNSFLEADDEEKELWLLKNGVDNEVLPNYSAIDCYTKTHLYERLQKPMLPDEYMGAADIMNAMLDDEPEPGISSLEDGADVLKAFLERSVRSDFLEAEDYSVIYRIREYARGRYGTDSDVFTQSEAILSGDGVLGVIKDAIKEGRAIELARNLGIDYKEAAFNALTRDFENKYSVAALLIEDNYRLDDVLQLIRERLEVDKIGTGSADETVGAEFVKHNKLSYLAQFLGAYPGKGTDIIKQMLRSPVVNNRFTALRVIEGWTDKTGLPLKDTEPSLHRYICEILAGEVRDDVRGKMKDLIK
ncbi:MAG: hypothetical protein HDT13_04740 [Butyrivibrio sp.]|nr:hypothetical protein [Butyrivibrio sp.]